MGIEYEWRILINTWIKIKYSSTLASSDDTLSIEEALDAIIQEEDASSTSKATLEMKETDDEIDNSEDDDIFNH